MIKKPILTLDNLDISGISRNKVMLLESGVELYKSGFKSND